MVNREIGRKINTTLICTRNFKIDFVQFEIGKKYEMVVWEIIDSCLLTIYNEGFDVGLLAKRFYEKDEETSFITEKINENFIEESELRKYKLEIINGL